MIRTFNVSKFQAFIIALLIAPLVSEATVFFNDTFPSSTSTLTNAAPPLPTTTSTGYQLSSSKAVTSTNALPGFLKYGIASTTGGGVEVQALFTTNPVALVLVNDYVQLTVTFTNEAGLLTASGAMGFGLFNGGQVQPIAGGAMINNALNTASDHVTGGVQMWQGYWGQLAFTGAGSRVLTRPSQTTGADNRNQNLTSTGSGSQSYAGPTGAVVGTATNLPVTLTPGSTYTVVFSIQLNAASSLAITNTLYAGPNTNGTMLYQFGGIATNATYLTSTFDAIAIGWRAQAATTGGTVINISSLKVDGVSTVVTTPPDIVTQPVPVSVATGGSAAFSVVAQGFGMTYQWHRNGTNLLNGGNISGANSDTLIINSASTADVASGANGYYVTVTGTGGFSTNSTTNALSLRTAANLVWSGSGNVWDLATTPNWLNGASSAVFNYGDAVTFDDGGAVNGSVTLTGKYLSASTVTVDGSAGYTFVNTSLGSFAGPGKLIYKGAGPLTLNNINTYSGGTIVSNPSAFLVVGNYSAIGTGPVTLAGGTMEVVPTGSASVGIAGDVIVQDDSTIQFDGTGAFGAVVLGNLSGTATKTLTINPKSLTTTNRYRFYGDNTVMNANIILNGPASAYPVLDGTMMAPYNPSGTQTYNGAISGNGGLIQRGGGTTILAGQNTYAGGTVPTTGTIGFGADSTPTSGTVTSGPIGVGPLIIAPEIPNTTGSGTVLAFGSARTIANPLQYPSGTNNQTLIIGGTNTLTFSGPVTLNGNDNVGGPVNRIFQVNNTNTPAILAGAISDGGAGFGIVKTGAGTLALSNTETYTGPTTVSNGTLQVNGQLGAGAVTVATNGTLGGTGIIGGAVTVQTGGALAPGASIGTLTINNNLTLGGNLNVEVNKSGSPTSDRVNVSGTLNNAGTGIVTVTNLGSTLAQGDTFTLFNKPVSSGNTLTVTGAGVTWTNKLAVDGTIAVLAVTSVTRTNISYSLSGNNLTLSWPADHIGWTLQVQTNAPGNGLSTSWSNVAGSASVNQVVIPIIRTNGSVFFRLVYP